MDYCARALGISWFRGEMLPDWETPIHPANHVMLLYGAFNEFEERVPD